MKKLLALVATLAFLVQFSGGTASSQAIVPPSVCPVNYVCSLLVTATEPLAGLPTDGDAFSFIGFLNFDSQSNITGVVSLNLNGHTVTNHAVSGASCTSGSATTLGQITIPVATPILTRTIVLNFVTHATSTGSDLLLSGETSTTPADTAVSAGICRASAGLR